MRRLFGRSAPLPTEYATQLAELGERRKPLAWAPALDGVCVAYPDTFAVLGRRGWKLHGWHDIESGGWNTDDNQLVWTLVTGGRGSSRLTDTGTFPDVFRERVQASIVYRRLVEVDGTRNGFTLSCRRNLSDDSLTWRVSPGKGTKMSDPHVRAAADLALAQARNEYDIS